MTSWLDEVLHGVRKRDATSRGVELRGIRVDELSAVDSPAHGVEDWLLIKAAGGKAAEQTKLRNLSDDELDSKIADLERAISENPDDLFLEEDLQTLKAEKTRRMQPGYSGDRNVQKRAQGWGTRLIAGQTIRFE